MALVSRLLRAYFRLKPGWESSVFGAFDIHQSIDRCVNEPVTDEDDQRQAVPELVRTRGGAGRIGSGHLVQEPVRGSAQALLVLLPVLSNGVSHLDVTEFYKDADGTKSHGISVQ